MAVAMNGAVQGVATITASAPVRKLPSGWSSSVAVARAPNSAGRLNSPSRFAATANITSINPPTTKGFCN